jgi:tetratricopeptide (TPR) repeat protein
MNQDTLEHLYVTGDYSLLLEEIANLDYNHPSTKLSDREKAICLSYHTRALIRLGEVNEAESAIKKISNTNFYNPLSLSSLIYQTSIINLHITQGNISEAIREGFKAESLIEQNKQEFSEYPNIYSFWSAFLYFLIGMAYYYQIKNDLAEKYFQKSLTVNQTNQYFKAKCFYYMAFMQQEKGNTSKQSELLERSLKIFQSIDAQQGIAWIFAWQGQLFLQKGEFKLAQSKLSQASTLFRSIRDSQGSSLVNSLIGLMYYQQGELEQAEEILEDAFDSSIKIGNPMILSYCYLPLVFLYIESKKRSKAQDCIHRFQAFSKTTPNEVVKLHGSLVEAIFLKSSSRFIDKGQAQQKFLKLLDNAYKANHPQSAQILPTSDKDISFLVVYHLIELYIEEFKLTEENKIMSEAQELIDKHINRSHDQKFSPKVVELSLLKAKMSIVEGKIENALAILEQVKQEANTNKFYRLEEKVDFEIIKIEKEFQKWDVAISVRERIEKVQIKEYLKEAQEMISLHREQ